MGFRNSRGKMGITHTNTSRYQIEEKFVFPNKTKHMVSGAHDAMAKDNKGRE